MLDLPEVFDEQCVMLIQILLADDSIKDTKQDSIKQVKQHKFFTKGTQLTTKETFKQTSPAFLFDERGYFKLFKNSNPYI